MLTGSVSMLLLCMSVVSKPCQSTTYHVFMPYVNDEHRAHIIDRQFGRLCRGSWREYLVLERVLHVYGRVGHARGRLAINRASGGDNHPLASMRRTLPCFHVRVSLPARIRNCLFGT